MSDMVLRLWQSIGVPSEMCNEYKKHCIQPSHRRHAWLVGLADPTNALPKGHIFVTGMKYHPPPIIFVTRSPCTRPDHGRMLPLGTAKPDSMSDDDWNWLQARPFGGIVFAQAPTTMLSMPERIASGDLDGDLYLVCWDNDILSNVHTDSMEDIEIPFKEKANEATPYDDPLWFSKAQDIMINVQADQDVSVLMRKLYTLAGKVAQEHSLRHPDAIAFSEGFDQALEFRKHGRPIQLPSHLHQLLPPNLQQHVSDIEI
jgi:RNA dependent RNA polymerase